MPVPKLFYSTLKNKGITDDEYETVQTAWQEKQMSTLFDLLKWYSMLDVRPFLEAWLNDLEPYKQHKLDFFKTGYQLSCDFYTLDR